MTLPACEILAKLDRMLNAPVELTLYGRAALLLGFADPLPDFGMSLDVDAVLWLGQAEALHAHTNFWDALERLNAELEPRGWYMTHLFTEDQVVLRPNWRQSRVPIAGEYARLSLFRLDNADLMLSKLMRDDPQDLKDALFIAKQAKFTSTDVERLLAEARIPDCAELREQFAAASVRLLDRLTPSTVH